jgi:DNA-binding transcriptional LysR family regulator
MTENHGRITLWGIEVFLAAADEGSISAAARRLGASVSTVSQQISALEQALGATLLDRDVRPILVTPAGDIFRRHAQVMANEALEARAQLAQSKMAGLTTLRLGIIEDFDSDVTPVFLMTLADTFPECRFVLQTGPSHRLLDQLEARALDMVVTADIDPMDEQQSWREVHGLLQEPFVLVAPRAHFGTLPLLEHMQTLPMIQYATRHVMGSMLARHIAQQNLSFPARFELDNYQAILSMVAGGAGWTVLTPLALHCAAQFSDAVDVIPLPFLALNRRIALSARKGLFRATPKETAALLRDQLQKQVVAPWVQKHPWLKESLSVLYQAPWARPL